MMPIIVAGYLKIKSGRRYDFLKQSLESVVLARAHSDCEDFAVSPDLVDEDRVNIFEKWQSQEALDAFRENGPDNGSFALIESFHIQEFYVGH